MRGARTRVECLGFKEFMTRVDGDRIKRMPPDTFEKFLPYAMAFGVEQHWAKAFQGLITEPPSWYVGSGYGTPGMLWTPLLFTNAMSTFSTSAYQSFSPRPRPVPTAPASAMAAASAAVAASPAVASAVAAATPFRPAPNATRCASGQLPGMAPGSHCPLLPAELKRWRGSVPARLHPVTDKSLIRLILGKSPYYQNSSHS